jgi:hypothetical protein
VSLTCECLKIVSNSRVLRSVWDNLGQFIFLVDLNCKEWHCYELGFIFLLVQTLRQCKKALVSCLLTPSFALALSSFREMLLYVVQGSSRPSNIKN